MKCKTDDIISKLPVILKNILELRKTKLYYFFKTCIILSIALTQCLLPGVLAPTPAKPGMDCAPALTPLFPSFHEAVTVFVLV